MLGSSTLALLTFLSRVQRFILYNINIGSQSKMEKPNWEVLKGILQKCISKYFHLKILLTTFPKLWAIYYQFNPINDPSTIFCLNFF